MFMHTSVLVRAQWHKRLFLTKVSEKEKETSIILIAVAGVLVALICFDAYSLALISTVFSDCREFSWGAQSTGVQMGVMEIIGGRLEARGDVLGRRKRDKDTQGRTE